MKIKEKKTTTPKHVYFLVHTYLLAMINKTDSEEMMLSDLLGRRTQWQ